MIDVILIKYNYNYYHNVISTKKNKKVFNIIGTIRFQQSNLIPTANPLASLRLYYQAQRHY